MLEVSDGCLQEIIVKNRNTIGIGLFIYLLLFDLRFLACNRQSLIGKAAFLACVR